MSKTIEITSILKELDEMELNSLNKILKFYNLLGWDQEKILNPVKIKMNPKQLDSIYQKECCQAEKFSLTTFDVAMVFLHYGPSASDNVEINTVQLEDGWISEEEKNNKQKGGL